MLIKNFKKFILISVLIFNSSAHAADDVAEMAGISAGAGAAKLPGALNGATRCGARALHRRHHSSFPGGTDLAEPIWLEGHA